MKNYFLLTLLLGCCSAFLAAADLTTRTQYTNIHFDESQTAVAKYIAQHIDALAEQVHAELGAAHVTITDVVIVDDAMNFNASASTLLEPVVSIHATAFLTGELIDNGDYILDTLKHELSHSISARINSEGAAFLANFMQFSIWAPNAVVPRGFQEGIAQVVEADNLAGSGRAYGQNSYYHSYWLAQWRNGFLSYDDFASLENRSATFHAYLYGAYFFSYVENRFGEQGIANWLAKRSNDIGYFKDSLLALDGSWQQAFAEPLAQTWQKFLQAEDAKLQQRYGKLITQPLQPVVKTNAAAGGETLISLYEADGATFVLAPIVKAGMARFGLFENGQLIKTFNLVRANNVQLASANDLYYLRQGYCQGREVADIVHYQLSTKKFTDITHCAQVFSFTVNQDHNLIAALEKTTTGSMVQTYNLAGQQPLTLWRGDYSQTISAVALRPNGQQLLVALQPKLGAEHNLWLFDVTGESAMQITSDAYLQRSPSFVNNNEVVYSRADNGIEQLFWLNLATGQEQQLTNTNEALLAPQVLNGKLYALKYDANELDLVSTPFMPKTSTQKFKIEKQRLSALSNETATEDNDEQKFLTQPYRFIENFKLQGVLPLPIYSSEQGLMLQTLMLFSDVKRKHTLELANTLNLTQAEVSLLLTYNFDNRFRAAVLSELDADKITTGYQAAYQQRQILPNVNFAQLAQVTALAELSTEQKLRNDWFGLGLAAESSKSCLNYSLTCQGWFGRFSIEHRDAQTSAADENNVGLLVNLYQPIATAFAARLSLDTRYAFEQNRFSLGASESHPLLRPLLTNGFEQRGYSQPLTGQWLSQLDARITKQWHYGRSFGSLALSVETLNATPFIQVGANENKEYQTTAGVELAVESTLLWMIPFGATAGVAQGLDTAAETDFYISLGFEF